MFVIDDWYKKMTHLNLLHRAGGMRDVITHHYFDIDAEIVFETIREKLPQLHKTIKEIITDLT